MDIFLKRYEPKNHEHIIGNKSTINTLYEHMKKIHHTMKKIVVLSGFGSGKSLSINLICKQLNYRVFYYDLNLITTNSLCEILSELLSKKHSILSYYEYSIKKDVIVINGIPCKQILQLILANLTIPVVIIDKNIKKKHIPSKYSLILNFNTLTMKESCDFLKRVAFFECKHLSTESLEFITIKNMYDIKNGLISLYFIFQFTKGKRVINHVTLKDVMNNIIYKDVIKKLNSDTNKEFNDTMSYVNSNDILKQQKIEFINKQYYKNENIIYENYPSKLKLDIDGKQLNDLNNLSTIIDNFSLADRITIVNEPEYKKYFDVTFRFFSNIDLLTDDYDQYSFSNLIMIVYNKKLFNMKKQNNNNKFTEYFK